MKGIIKGPSRDQVGTKLALSWHQVEILRKSLESNKISDLMIIAGRSNRTKFRHQVMNPLLDAGWIEMTIPDKPTSRNQQYRITESGRALLDQLETGSKGA